MLVSQSADQTLVHTSPDLAGIDVGRRCNRVQSSVEGLDQASKTVVVAGRILRIRPFLPGPAIVGLAMVYEGRPNEIGDRQHSVLPPNFYFEQLAISAGWIEAFDDCGVGFLRVVDNANRSAVAQSLHAIDVKIHGAPLKRRYAH